MPPTVLPSAGLRLEVELWTRAAQRDIRFGGILEGRGRAIIVTSVAPGSEAEEMGIEPGSKLVAISDPVRSGDLWELNERASLRFVRDSLQMRINGRITLVTVPPTDVVRGRLAEAAVQAQAMAEARAAAVVKDGTQTLTAEEADGQEAELKLESTLSIDEQREKSMVEARIKARKDYLNVVGQRDDSKLFILLGTAFLLPAAVILAVAFATGYLDALQVDTLRGL
mmetsp:Transcript_1790/g.5212  ORF Transcript_1790/g.5212 Transcript_1790/m.5212 type:complete len:226 (+) Transcript_1790:764-1441(+)